MHIEFLPPEPDDQPPTSGEILAVICDAFDVEPEAAIQWLDKFDGQTAYIEHLADLCTLKDK